MDNYEINVAQWRGKTWYGGGLAYYHFCTISVASYVHREQILEYFHEMEKRFPAPEFQLNLYEKHSYRTEIGTREA